MGPVLFDFDGVLTDQTEEATRVLDLFTEEIASEEKNDLAAARALVDAARVEVESAPHRHGWRSHGRISGYADEDLFVRNNGIAALLDDRNGGERYRAAAERAFNRLADETKRGEHQPVDPGGAAALRALLAAGRRIVVVSNSGTSRILDLLTRAGLPAVAHEKDPNAALRIRGGAQKFTLSDTPSNGDAYDIGPYRIHVDRPTYLRILKEERPVAVVGDVFSLDLGVPLYLARTDPDFRDLLLFLRVRPYTPRWSRAYVAEGAGPSTRALDSLDAGFENLL